MFYILVYKYSSSPGNPKNIGEITTSLEILTETFWIMLNTVLETFQSTFSVLEKIENAIQIVLSILFIHETLIPRMHFFNIFIMYIFAKILGGCL